MNPSKMYDPKLHEAGSAAAQGRCTHHDSDTGAPGPCAEEAVVSFQDPDGRWHSGCSLALEQLVERGEIEPFGQGA